jgi:hypothetical protein
MFGSQRRQDAHRQKEEAHLAGQGLGVVQAFAHLGSHGRERRPIGRHR